MVRRYPLTPAEFDEACRKLVRECPWLSETSGYRSKKHNAKVGGSEKSKHLMGMARDYVSGMEGLRQGSAAARNLSLWSVVHDTGSGSHLHVQGLPTGDNISSEWIAKYGR